ncbi:MULTISPECIES: AraC family transcriptional regulator [Hoeflea]|uniref:Helix-turn-helix domain-containing protein n=1 Tax=Hoeflea alexandrii TaxID=288436 RepID=A0ABT1CLJ6_9HYPH|nr:MULTISPECIES: AraC family transcriptional regulator [Hoeflea]MCO6407079.1 helix-turn-helix domain-containing protein [Hoeflea alexandrii]MCY0154488.1 AraC family transcriptional regulator [Hoeflea alexandrii]VVT04251.1 AraC family transcriptional regulator [Hoeflea sp. EC-HK425]
MTLQELARSVDHFAGEHAETVKGCETGIAGLFVHRQTRPSPFEATVYNPVICLNLQGCKEVTCGDRTLGFGAGQSLIVSHDVPVMARVTEASAQHPYLAIIVALDIAIIQSLCDEVGETVLDRRQASTLTANATDGRIIEAIARYFALARDPLEAKVMQPLILREIHFRLLTASHGGMLRQLMQRDSHASRISRAIGRIRSGYRAPLAVASLAAEAGMSPSSFHEHFRHVTGTTPLQYQKELRLMEARRLLSMDGLSVSSAAFEVGYESATQFSREYSRKFGAPPRNDVFRAAAASESRSL